MDIVINTYGTLDSSDIERISKNVKFLMRYGTGYEKIDVTAATKCGIPFANTPGANAQAVAEIALLHILNCGRNFIKSYVALKEKNKWPGDFSGNELEGKTLGLMGFGNIARHLVRLVKGFDVSIVAYDPFLGPAGIDYAKENNVSLVSSPEELFSLSDIVSLHLPVTPETKMSVNKSLFGHAKKGMILVNTCRGAIINEADLVDALNDGTVRCAGLDVLANEPPTPDNPLLNMENVFVTSHTAGSSDEAEMRTQDLIWETVEKFRNGEFNWNVINKNEIKKGV